MKFPKYFCSTCGKPSSRKWNLYRHIGNCHDGLGNCVSNWDFPVATSRPHWNRWESNDRKPFDYQRTLKEAFLKELAEKMAASIIQPTQSKISFPFSYEFSYAISSGKLLCGSYG